MYRIRVFLSTLMLGVVMSCENSTGPAPSLSATLAVESSTVQVGDSTVLTMVVRNLSSVAVTRTVPQGSLAFDVAIERSTGGEVWRRSNQFASKPAATLTIPPLSSVEFRCTLRIGGPVGAALPPGDYRVRGFLVNAGTVVITEAMPALSISVRASQ